jgi:hypothetical protein
VILIVVCTRDAAARRDSSEIGSVDLGGSGVGEATGSGAAVGAGSVFGASAAFGCSVVTPFSRSSNPSSEPLIFL